MLSPDFMLGKLFFKIREVAQITQVEPHVLRFWESEFNQLHPNKSKSGQRIYTREDVELILEIKKLLYQERFSIEGAKNRLSKKKILLDKPEQTLETFQNIKKDLMEILEILKA